MHPLQIARAHCSNFQHDGSCLGAWIDDDLQIRHCGHKAECLLKKRGARCPYFEECVAPIGAQLEAHERGYSTLYIQQVREALDQYHRAAEKQQEKHGGCKDCGRLRAPRGQYCVICAARRNKENQRRWAAAKRADKSKNGRRKSLALKPPNLVIYAKADH
jgi:hypothetical protein